jgi:hypothetical protein
LFEKFSLKSDKTKYLISNNLEVMKAEDPIIVSFVKVKTTQIGASFFTPNKYPHNLGALKRAFGWLKYGS